MTKVTAFKTEDGRIHDTELDATSWEYHLSVRSLIHSSIAGPLPPTFPTATVANFIVQHAEEIRDITRKFSTKLARLEKKNETAVTA